MLSTLPGVHEYSLQLHLHLIDMRRVSMSWISSPSVCAASQENGFLQYILYEYMVACGSLKSDSTPFHTQLFAVETTNQSSLLFVFLGQGYFIRV